MAYDEEAMAYTNKINESPSEVNRMKHLKAFKDMFYLFSFYWKYGKKFFFVTLLVEMIFIPLSTFLNLNITRAVVDAIAEGKAFLNVLALIGIYLALLFCLKLINDIYSRYSSPIEAKIFDKIRKSVYKKALATDYNFINNPEYFNNYTWTINDFTDYVNTAKSSIVSFISLFSGIFVIITMMSSVSFFLMLFVIINIIISTLISFPKNKLSHQADEKLVYTDRRLGFVNRIFYLRENAADLKCTRAGEFMFSVYDDAADEKVSILKRFVPKRILFSTFDNLNTIITSFLIMLYLSYEIIHNNLSIGSFAALFSASWSLRSYISSLTNIVVSANSISFYVQKMRVFMDAKSKIESPDDAKDLIDPQTHSPFRIDLSGASFKYEHSNFGLKGIDMHIPAGAKAAIVGENGSGKSTLVKLLLRLYDFDDGSYEIDGPDIKKYDIHKTRTEIGVAFQQPVIYSFSLKDNVKLYREVSDDKVLEILDMLDLIKVLEKSGADIDSYITKEFSEDGIELSGGEEQKLGLARVYTGDFGLLLLDEPSSALDPLAEAKLNKVIRDKNVKATTVVISHRLSNIVDADMIYLMKDGEIAEQGTHSELIRKKGMYYEMFEAQAEKYREQKDTE